MHVKQGSKSRCTNVSITKTNSVENLEKAIINLIGEGIDATIASSMQFKRRPKKKVYTRKPASGRVRMAEWKHPPFFSGLCCTIYIGSQRRASNCGVNEKFLNAIRRKVSDI